MTVLGKSPAWADEGGACSGYLVESGGARLLLDCGPGVFGKLRTACDYAAVDAVVLSHLHADHILDLIPYASALIFGPRRGRPRPRLLGPPGARAALARVSAAAGMGEDHLERAFAFSEYEPTETALVAHLRLRFQPLPHYIASNAIEVADGDGARLTFSGDCGPNDALAPFAADTGLLLVEASVSEHELAGLEGFRGHLTPREAGEQGRRAGARRLVLTHISDELDVAAALREASDAFGGQVEVAAERAVYEL